MLVVRQGLVEVEEVPQTSMISPSHDTVRDLVTAAANPVRQAGEGASSTARVLRDRPRSWHLQGEMQYRVHKLLGLGSLGHKLQVTDALADRDPQLVGVDHAAEANTFHLALLRYSKQVVVLAEEHSPQLGGAIQNLVVGSPGAAVLLCRDDIDASLRRPTVIARLTFSSM